MLTLIQIRPAIPQLTLPENRSILIIGGLKGLCGSLAVYLAKLGAKNLVAMGRSGYDDERSQSVLRDLKAEGCHIDLVRGDVSNTDDVRKAFSLGFKANWWYHSRCYGSEGRSSHPFPLLKIANMEKKGSIL